MKPVNPDRALVTNVVDALQGIRHLPDTKEAPFWTDPRDNDPSPSDLLPFNNGVLDLRSFEMREPDPRLFALHRVDCDYDPEAEAPAWDEFLRSSFPDENEQESRDTIEEIVGYILSGETSRQKAFIFEGKPRSGKGTIARVIKELVGADRFTGPTISSFSGEFGLQQLIGKAVAVIADARGRSRFDPHVLVERILSITGEDALSVNRKHQNFWHGTLPTRLILASNVPPKLTDPSGVVVSRFIAVAFQQSFLGREDHGLMDRLLAELPGIANRALAGLKRLRERGHFIQPETGLEILEQMDESTGPVRAFVRDECVMGQQYQIVTQTLYEHFVEWSAEHGHQRMSSQTFGVDLFALGQDIKKVQIKNADGSRTRVYRGIDHAENLRRNNQGRLPSELLEMMEKDAGQGF